MKIHHTERVLVDLTSPLRAMFVPTAALIFYTGLAWMLIGWMDSPEHYLEAPLRNAVVVIWALVALFRFVMPIMRQRRRHLIVTNQRIVTRDARLGSRYVSIPLGQVAGVRRQRKGVMLQLVSQPQPVMISGIPKAKKVVGAIEAGTRYVY